MPISSSASEHLSLDAASPNWLEWVYEGVLETVPWSCLLEQLRLHLQANFVSLAIRPPGLNDPGLLVFSGSQVPAARFSYERSFYTLDPFVDLPADQVWMLHERVDEAQWLSSELYRDLLSLLDVRYVLGADLDIGTGQSSRLRISRGCAAQPFSEADRQLCQRLLVHLQRALKLYVRLDAVESERRLYAATLQCLSIGSLLLDAQGEILQCSEAAQGLLAGDYGLRIVANRLQADAGMDERRLWRSIHKVLQLRSQEHSASVEALSIGWPGKGLGVLLRGLAPRCGDEKGLPAAIEVILRDPLYHPEVSEALLRQLFQLTPAEALLAVQLCHGQTLEQAALALNISRNTARAHLRVIFSKTGTARQANLVQLLQSSVAALQPLAVTN